MQEQLGQAAGSFIDALKGQPLSLALVAMNLGLLGFLYYNGVTAHNERKEEMQLLYENRREMAHLLYLCNPTTDKAPPLPPRPQL
jgi:hypothetical protein